MNSHAGYASAIAIALLAITLLFSIFNVRILERGDGGRGMSHAADVRSRRRSPDLQRVAPRRAGAARERSPRARSGTSSWRFLAVITVFPFFWMLMTSLKGPGDPIYSIAAAVPPDRPDARRLRAGPPDAADPDVLPEQPDRRGRGRAAQRAGRGDGRLPAGEDAVPRPLDDLLPAARDADRAGPADLHPELHPGGQRLPLLRHAAGADLPEPRQRLQHLPAAPGVPGRPATT